MSGTSGASGPAPGSAEQPGVGTGAGGAGEARPELDETSKQILEDDRNAELNRLATPEIGTTTDPASGEPRRGEP